MGIIDNCVIMDDTHKWRMRKKCETFIIKITVNMRVLNTYCILFASQALQGKIFTSLSVQVELMCLKGSCSAALSVLSVFLICSLNIILSLC